MQLVCAYSCSMRCGAELLEPHSTVKLFDFRSRKGFQPNVSTDCCLHLHSCHVHLK